IDGALLAAEGDRTLRRGVMKGRDALPPARPANFTFREVDPLPARPRPSSRADREVAATSARRARSRTLRTVRSRWQGVRWLRELDCTSQLATAPGDPIPQG